MPMCIMNGMKKPANKNKAHEAPRKKNYNNIKEYKVTKECELLEFLLETQESVLLE